MLRTTQSYLYSSTLTFLYICIDIWCAWYWYWNSRCWFERKIITENWRIDPYKSGNHQNLMLLVYFTTFILTFRMHCMNTRNVGLKRMLGIIRNTTTIHDFRKGKNWMQNELMRIVDYELLRSEGNKILFESRIILIKK